MIATAVASSCPLVNSFAFLSCAWFASILRINDAAGNTRVYVGNLPWATTKEELEELMSEAGVVVDARIMFGYDGKSKGCA